MHSASYIPISAAALIWIRLISDSMLPLSISHFRGRMVTQHRLHRWHTPWLGSRNSRGRRISMGFHWTRHCTDAWAHWTSPSWASALWWARGYTSWQGWLQRNWPVSKWYNNDDYDDDGDDDELVVWLLDTVVGGRVIVPFDDVLLVVVKLMYYLFTKRVMLIVIAFQPDSVLR